jgi:hypothetical protein
VHNIETIRYTIRNEEKTEISEEDEHLRTSMNRLIGNQQLLNLCEIVKSLTDRIAFLDDDVSKLRLELTLSTRFLRTSDPEDSLVSRTERYRKKDKGICNKLFY